MNNLTRFLPIAVIVLLLIGGVAWVASSGGGTKTVTAFFPRAVSVYEGSDVRVLGVPVGVVEEVVPEGTQVKVTMRYDDDVEVPMDAQAVIVSPSVVGDRYVQLSPAYTGGEVLPDNTVLEVDRNAIPLELDEIYESMDEMIVALGPEGANKKGALNDLLQVTAENFGGQGEKFHQTIEDFGQLSATLDRNKEDLFASVEELQGFMQTFADNDATVRDFNRSLGDISEVLADERQELADALKFLGEALNSVRELVHENKGVLSRDIKKTGRLAKILVKQRDALDEILEVAPLAYNNLAGTYNPQMGTLDTNANLGQLEGNLEDDPALTLCSLLGNAEGGEELCTLFETIFPRSGPFGAGTGSRVGSTYDPTLAGLVVVE